MQDDDFEKLSDEPIHNEAHLTSHPLPSIANFEIDDINFDDY